MINKIILRKYSSAFAIIIFIILFGSVNIMKPSLIYNDDLTFRQFGLGYRKKTIIPIWLVAIILAFISYLLVMYIISMPGMKF